MQYATLRKCILPTLMALALAACESSTSVKTQGFPQISFNSSSMALWRFLPDGTPDVSFGNGGLVLHRVLPASFASGYALALDGFGRIVVAGETGYAASPNSTDMIVWRFNDNGSPDGSFGNGGFVTHRIAPGTLNAGLALSLDPTGYIVVAGGTGPNALDMALWRLEENGVGSVQFGGAGFVTHHNAAGGNGIDFALAVADDGVQDYITVVGGSDSSGGGRALTVWRYTFWTGVLDTALDADGVATFDGVSGAAMALDGDGRILIAGNIGLGAIPVLRLNTNGTLDATFPGGTPDSGTGRSLALDASGNIAVAGGGSDIRVWRANGNGVLDSGFGGTGAVDYDGAASGWDSARAVAVDASGRIVVAGSVERADYQHDEVLLRFLPNGTLDNTFGNQGVVIYGATDGSSTGYAMLLDGLGRIVVAGRTFVSQKL